MTEGLGLNSDEFRRRQEGFQREMDEPEIPRYI